MAIGGGGSDIWTPSSKLLLCFSLRTNLPFNAKMLARRLTEMSDLLFAANAEMTMAIAPETQVQMLENLARFEIEAFEHARAIAAPRSAEMAAIDLQREEVLQSTLCQALYLGDREVARAPLRHVASQLGLSIAEDCEDWTRLAYEATKVLLDISKERHKRQQGFYEQPTPVFQRAISTDVTHHRPATLTSPQGSSVAPASFASTAVAQNRVMPSADAPIATAPEPLTHRVQLEEPSFEKAPAAPVSKDSQADQTEDLSSTPLVIPADLDAPDGYSAQQWQDARILARPPKIYIDRKLLTDETRAALEKKRGITLREAIVLHFELISLGYVAPFDTPKKRMRIDPDIRSKPVEDRLNEDHKGKFRFALNFWLGVLGDVPVDEISFDEVNDALETMWRVPKNHGRSSAEREKYSMIELIEVADAKQAKADREIAAAKDRGASAEEIDKLISTKHVKRLRVDTYLKHGRVPRAIGETLFALQIIDHDPFSICNWTTEEVEQLKSTEGAHARRAWDDRLCDLFHTPIFQEPLEDVGDPMFWAPLIARHMGMRMEECLQLGPDDFGFDKGIAYLRIERTIINGTKTLSSERDLPVHPQLLSLGLLKLVNLRKKQGHIRLFPCLTGGVQKGTFSANFSKRFGYYRKTNGCYWAGLDFHSLRTTFHTDLLTDDKSDAVRCRLMGHVPKDEGAASYAQSLGIQTLFDRLQSVQVDISMIRKPFGPDDREIGSRAAEHGLRVVS
ncbi:hypothetical protein [Sulfitobacter alexandrii]|nr:hypothetical protein [Sulfitobacter alexandrii]